MAHSSSADPHIHPLAKKMDCRVKPGNDSHKGHHRAGAQRRDPVIHRKKPMLFDD
jgi:hypothetical protein